MKINIFKTGHVFINIAILNLMIEMPPLRSDEMGPPKSGSDTSVNYLVRTLYYGQGSDLFRTGNNPRSLDRETIHFKTVPVKF